MYTKFKKTISNYHNIKYSFTHRFYEEARRVCSDKQMRIGGNNVEELDAYLIFENHVIALNVVNIFVNVILSISRHNTTTNTDYEVRVLLILLVS